MDRMKLPYLVCLLFVLMFSGCMLQSNKTAVEKKENVDLSSYGSKKADIVNNGRQQLSGHVVFMTNRIDKAQNAINELISRFTAENPGVTVEIAGTRDPIYDIEVRMAAAELCDITPVPKSMNKNNYHSYLLPLSGASFKPEKLVLYENGLGQDGKLYAVNSALTYYGIIYNKKAFRKAGVVEIPKTTDEFMKVCRQLKVNDIIPMGTGYKDGWPMKVFLSEAFLVPITGRIDYLQKKANDSLLLDEGDGFQIAFDFLRNLQKNRFIESSLTSATWERAKIEHAKGDIAMVAAGTDYIAQLIDSGASESDIGIFPFPNSKVILYEGDWSFGISKWSGNSEVAMALLRWLWEEGRYARALGTIPPYIDSIVDFPAVNQLLDSGYTTVRSEADSYVDIIYMADKAKIDLIHEIKKYMVSDYTYSLIKDINSRWAIRTKEND